MSTEKPTKRSEGLYLDDEDYRRIEQGEPPGPIPFIFVVIAGLIALIAYFR